MISRQDAYRYSKPAQKTTHVRYGASCRLIVVEQITGDDQYVIVIVPRKIDDLSKRIAKLLSMTRALVAQKRKRCIKLNIARVKKLDHFS
jgi:hypothetical protein